MTSNRPPRPLLWLAAGALLLALSQMRFGVGALAWIAPVPLLRFLRLTDGWRSRGLLLLFLLAAFGLATLKIVTPPLTAPAAFLFAVPFAAFHGAGYIAWDAARRRAPRWASVLAFPAVMVVAEHGQHRLTPFGSWTAAAYTQVENLPLLQVASIAGIAGVGFLVYWIAAALAEALEGGRAALRPLAAAGAAVLAAHGFGSWRIGRAPSAGTELVAAVMTDATFSGLPLPAPEEVRRIDDGLLERTSRAARAGARLVAWPEAATLVLPAEEPAFQARLGAAAREHGIHLVAGYVVPLPGEPFRYENKLAWARPDGAIDHTYLKHEPVPGEPAVRGTGAPRAVDTPAGRAAGAICYDYDFPRLALAHARLGADLVVVPSSDWAGIDPIHTQMASLRAIEGGFSLLRATRLGLSAGYDAHGRPRAWASSFEPGDRVLLARLPRERVETVYSAVGDAFVAAAALFAAFSLAQAWRRRYRESPGPGLSRSPAAGSPPGGASAPLPPSAAATVSRK